MRCYLLLTGLVLLTGCHKGPETLQASRAAEKGCAWGDYRDEKQGFSVLVQQCDAGRSGVEEAKKSIKVYPKAVNVGIEQAIRERFFPAFNDLDRAGCAVMPQTRVMFPDPIQTLEIVPYGVYSSDAARKREEPGFVACGDHGQGGYFEYHPHETLTKYAFVRAGQQPLLFDERSLRFQP